MIRELYELLRRNDLTPGLVIEEHLSPCGNYHSPHGVKPIGEFLDDWAYAMDAGWGNYDHLRRDTRRWLGIVHEDGAVLVSLDDVSETVLDKFRASIDPDRQRPGD